MNWTKSRSEQSTRTKVEKSTTFPPIWNFWKTFKFTMRRSRGGSQKHLTALRTRNYPLKRKITSSISNSTWELELSGLGSGQKGIECLFARFNLGSFYFFKIFVFYFFWISFSLENQVRRYSLFLCISPSDCTAWFVSVRMFLRWDLFGLLYSSVQQKGKASWYRQNFYICSKWNWVLVGNWDEAFVNASARYDAIYVSRTPSNKTTRVLSDA